jgi:hypothetical protein
MTLHGVQYWEYTVLTAIYWPLLKIYIRRITPYESWLFEGWTHSLNVARYLE